MEEIDLMKKNKNMCIGSIKIPQLNSDLNSKQTKSYIKNIYNYKKLKNKGEE